MNIFVTDPDPVKSAQYLDDVRVNKMILESAQMLSTACRLHGFNDEQLYKVAHQNHPATIWTRTSRENYMWLYNHYIALGKEKIQRTGKSHKSYDEKKDILLQGAQYIPSLELTPFANCASRQEFGISYKHLDDVHLAYQLYLNDRWDKDKREPTWYGESR